MFYLIGNNKEPFCWLKYVSFLYSFPIRIPQFQTMNEIPIGFLGSTNLDQCVCVCLSLVVCAVKALSTLVVGKTLEEITGDFRGFYRLLSSDGQMRWVSINTESRCFKTSHTAE